MFATTRRTIMAMGLALASAVATPAGAADLLRVAEGPFITGGAFLIAREKGYFKKLGLEIEPRRSSTAPSPCRR
jgi:ABC-type nitrate/sulfonate/bicarbonate transport system substrate-binding protein